MANFEILAWAADRRTMLRGLQDAAYITVMLDGVEVDPDTIPDAEAVGYTMAPIPGLQIVEQNEFGTPVVTPGVYDAEGNEITPPVLASGYHVNGRCFDAPENALATQMTWQLPQTYAEAAQTPPVGKTDGDLMPIWDRTHSLSVHPTLEFMAALPPTSRAGYRNPAAPAVVYFYDEGSVTSRHNIWA